MAAAHPSAGLDQLVARAASTSRTTKKRKRTSSVAKVCRTVTKKVKVRGKVRRRKVRVCKPRCRTVTKKVKVGGKVRRRKVKVCTPSPTPKKTRALPPSDQLPPSTVAPVAADPPSPGGSVPADTSRVLSAADVERLLWRAGFGPRRGEAAALAGRTLGSLVDELTSPTTIRYRGAAPVIDGQPLAPGDLWGDDHLDWLDRMVRCEQPLLERMALIWHDWFATNTTSTLMLAQIQTFREKGLGSFDELLRSVTIDPAMLEFLNGIDNSRWNPNENYAREVMELFTLGAGRGAYSEQDIREAARALTGWTATWNGSALVDFRFDAKRHDATSKTVFGQSGAFGWQDVVRLCVEHPLHASFFCTKLWSYFIPTPPDDATLAALMKVYLDSGRQIRPVVAAILRHPLLLDGGMLVKPPVVYNAGLLRALDRRVDTKDWAWLSVLSGQQTFRPPNVAGWDDSRWLDTSTIRGRWALANYALRDRTVNPWPAGGAPAGFTPDSPEQALDKALDVLGRPQIGDGERSTLLEFARSAIPAGIASWERYPLDASRQNALRMLIATSPERHCS